MATSFMTRWGINDDEEKKRRVFNVFFNYLEKLREPIGTEEERFYNYLGERYYSNQTHWREINALPRQVEWLEPYKEKLIDLAERTEAILNSVNWDQERKVFIAEFVNNHPNEFGFFLTKEGEQWISLRSGDDNLDTPLIKESLKSLDGSSKAQKEFLAALSLYKEGKWTPSITKSRRVLEELLHSYLKNDKNLDNNAAVLASRLMSIGYSKENINLVVSQIKLLDKKYNDIEKHKFVENDEKFAELFLYLTGSIIRIITRIKNDQAIKVTEQNEKKDK